MSLSDVTFSGEETEDSESELSESDNVIIPGIFFSIGV